MLKQINFPYFFSGLQNGTFFVHVHITSRNAPYVHVHPRLDSILELCRTIPNEHLLCDQWVT